MSPVSRYILAGFLAFGALITFLAAFLTGKELPANGMPVYVLSALCVVGFVLCVLPWEAFFRANNADDEEWDEEPQEVEQAAQARGATKEGIALRCAEGRHRGRVWRLQDTPEALVLVNHKGQVVASIEPAEAGLRIRLPSFWQSIANIVILDESEEVVGAFEPKPRTVARVKALIEGAHGQASPAAASKMREKAFWSLIVGIVLLGLGLVITLATFVLAGPGGTFVVTTGLIGVGLAGIARYFYWTSQARQVDAIAEDDVPRPRRRKPRRQP